MEPKTLSASAIKTYEQCPARFKAEYIDRVRITSSGGTAADGGTLFHDVAEWWMNQNPRPASDAIAKKMAELAPNYGVTGEQLRGLKKMAFAWYSRFVTENPAPVVLATESKKSTPIRVVLPDGRKVEVPLTYIIDRLDRVGDTLRVVDYKTWVQYRDGQEIFNELQARIYAYATAVEFKDEQPERIGVMFDQVRFDIPQATIYFDREQIRIIWAYLKQIVERILLDDEARETVGDGCRFCVRAAGCSSLARAVEAGTVMAWNTPQDAARKLAELSIAEKAMKDVKTALKDYLSKHLESVEETHESYENGTYAKVGAKRKRIVNQDIVIEALGAEMAARLGEIGVTKIDDLLKGKELTPEQKEVLTTAITDGLSTWIDAGFSK